MSSEENNQLETRLDDAALKDQVTANKLKIDSLEEDVYNLIEDLRALKARLFHPSEN